ncbi:MAG: hypothetical protein ABIA12_02550 [Candidatus Aenigmatarchaeota archaeon]
MDKYEKILAKWGFYPFEVGTLEHPLDVSSIGKVGPDYKRVRVSTPGRFLSGLRDLRGLVIREPTGEFNYGEVSFGVDLRTYADVSLHDSDSIHVTGNTERPSIIRHFAEIMRKQLNYDGGLLIEANNDFPYHHVGSGSSAALATAEVFAINKLLGNPIKKEDLPLLIARNYGEEIQEDPNKLITVQCTGGTSWMGLLGGLIMVYNSQPIQRMDIPEGLVYIAGVPEYPKPDAKGAMARETVAVFQHILDNASHMETFFKERFQDMEASIKTRDMEEVGKVIFETYSDERFMTGYDNMFPELKTTFWDLRKLLKRYSPATSFISSAGPAIVTLCGRDVGKEISRCYNQLGINYVFEAQPTNSGFRYETLERE